MRTLLSAVLIALMLGAPGSIARAQDQAQEEQPQNLSNGGSWTFKLAPYVWFAGMDGDIGVNPNLPVVDVDVDFTEIFDNIDWWPPPLMVVGEARFDDFALITDFMFIGLDTNAARTRGVVPLSVDLEQDTIIWTLVTSFLVLETETMTVDFLAGVRLWNIDADATLVGPLAVRERSGSKTWVDPIVGAVGHIDLGSGFGLKVEGDIGGFGLASDLDWQVVGTVQYAIGEATSLEIGYRYLSVDYTQGGFLYDTAMSGPIIGASFRF